MIISPIAYALIGFLCGILTHEGILWYQTKKRHKQFEKSAAILAKRFAKWEERYLSDESAN